MREYIPDPIELGEARAEQYSETNWVGDKIRCVKCREPKDLRDVTSLSADPYSPPICLDCVEKICQQQPQHEEGGE